MPSLRTCTALSTLIVAGLLASNQAHAGTCPSGTTLRGAQPPNGNAQWCEVGETPSNALPIPGRTYDASLDMTRSAPVPMAGRTLRGPMTTWFDSGQVQSHGSYEPNAQGDSVPNGLWTIYFETGQVRSQGSFEMGEPTGCFSFWDADGSQFTATWSAADSEFQGTDCEGPTGERPATLRTTNLRATYDAAPLGDVGIQTFLTTGGFGIKNDSFLIREPSLSYNGEFYFRRYLGNLRLGGRLGLRTSDDGFTQSGVATTTIGYALPTFYDPLAFELSAAIGLQVIEADLSHPDMPNQRSQHTERFTELYAALEPSASWRVHDYVEIVATGRLEGGLPRSKNISTLLCNANGCPDPAVDATWDLGRYSVGVALGMRFLLR